MCVCCRIGAAVNCLDCLVQKYVKSKKGKRKGVESKNSHPRKINTFFYLLPNGREKWFVTSLTFPRNGSIRIEEMASFQAHKNRDQKKRSETSRPMVQPNLGAITPLGARRGLVLVWALDQGGGRSDQR